MKYVNYKGKEVRVSDKRFKEYCERWDNSPIWLDFRVKHFTDCCREELIMHPQFKMEMWGKDRKFYDITFYKGKFWFGERGTKQFITDDMCFETPDDAYEYFEQNIGEYNEFNKEKEQ